LLADPAGMVERVYAAAGAQLSAGVRDAVEAENAKSLSGDRAPAHRYTLAAYGVSEEQVAERFAGYRGLDARASGPAPAPDELTRRPCASPGPVQVRHAPTRRPRPSSPIHLRFTYGIP